LFAFILDYNESLIEKITLRIKDERPGILKLSRKPIGGLLS
jgi:hypothetical protein